ncbi:substrate-binding domain-containing protein [Acidisoma silvae]|uniref:Substrate-binding domain-containing protein n=2 Tax=Acidisoma silvae TaxID=2802396 RepID=A0A963YXC5_9PROT|nr:substrate-binding domain-containing protein [Acidisoma silvae]
MALGCHAAKADDASALKDTSKSGIALSNSYAGNTWRQQMLRVWQAAAQQAIDGHIIAKTKIVNADASAPQQASQIENLILEGWNSIVLDAASPTALNGSIEDACKQGITVVVFDSLATAPCAYKVAYDYVEAGRIPARFIVQQLHGKGNVLVVRGMPGTQVDVDEFQGAQEVFKENPGIKVVGTVNGQWTESVANKEVAGILPSLPKVDAVIGQGGDSVGTYQAFKAAGRPIPLITLGTRQEELALWEKLDKATPGGYATEASSSVPGVSSIAFWVAQQIVAGRKVPNVVKVSLLQISKADLATWLKVTPVGAVASPVYSKEWTIDLLKSIAANTAPPPSPGPTQNK